VQAKNAGRTTNNGTSRGDLDLRGEVVTLQTAADGGCGGLTDGPWCTETMDFLFDGGD
jgi:hypothetical protein